MEKFARFIIKHRLIIAVITALITVYLAYQIRYLSFATSLERTLPMNHPYVRIHVQFMQLFGGANFVIIGVKQKEGTIFQPQFLEKLKVITEKIMFYPDAITSQVISIARQKVKNIQGTPDGVDVRALYKTGVPKTPVEINELEENIFSNELLRGFLVSQDKKMAFILANFKEEGVDYEKLFNFFNTLQTDVAGKDIELYVSGRPMLMGWIYHNNPRSMMIFIISVVAEFIVLFIFLFHYRFIFICMPLLLGFANAIWGLGIMGLSRFNLDPLGLVIPFVIGARLISHAVQMNERYGEYAKIIEDKKEATVATLTTMFLPSAAGLLCDAAGLFALCLVPIPLLRTLGWIAGTWLLGAIIGVTLLQPILFSYFPYPLKKMKAPEFMTGILGKWGAWIMASTRNVMTVVVVWVAIFVVSLVLSTQVKVGDVHPGSPLLWPKSPYNQQDVVLNEYFGGTNPLFVIIQGKKESALKDPRVLRAIEALERELVAKCPEVGGTETLVGIIKKLNREYHEGDPKWSKLPNTLDECGFYLWAYSIKGEPGDFDRWADIPLQNGNLISYFKDHRGDTISQAIQVCKDFLARYPVPRDLVEFKLAGGIQGVTAGLNEVVEQYHWLTLFVALFAIFLCCVIPYRSLMRGFVLLFSIVTGNLITLGYMVIAGMGMTISILPVASIGAGLGVDYGIFMLSRIIDEVHENGGDVKKAIVTAFPTTGRAVAVTGLTVIVGIVFWYFSEVKFQADMGALLAFLLIVNMVGALSLVPALAYLLRARVLPKE